MNKPVLAILGNDAHRAHLEPLLNHDIALCIWFTEEQAFLAAGADFHIAMETLQSVPGNCSGHWLISQTVQTLADAAWPENALVARFCGWPTFFERPVWEIAVNHTQAAWLEDLSQLIGKKFELVADVPGLVAPSVVACIINEAYYAMAEGICSAADLDRAMKLGTNYPRGPLEWAAAIGPVAVAGLLRKLEDGSGRYRPHPNLEEGVVYG